MANPNKTFAKAAAQMERPVREAKPVTDPFMVWLFEQAQAGRRFNTIEEAQAEFQKEKGTC